MAVEVGDQAPEFTLPSHLGGEVALSHYRGKKHVVLSFHVLSFTGGWTHQVSGFRLEDSRFQEKDAQVLGISVDSVAVQRAFSSTLGNIPYPLLADFHPKGQVSQLYGVYNEERGTSVRSVFVIDKEGIVRFKRLYEQGLPDPADILKEVESLG